MVSQVIWYAVRSKPVSCSWFRLWLDWRITPMCKVKVAKCYDNRIRIQASLLFVAPSQVGPQVSKSGVFNRADRLANVVAGYPALTVMRRHALNRFV
jgi:hypothetical protein